jgi:hypothetical protein
MLKIPPLNHESGIFSFRYSEIFRTGRTTHFFLLGRERNKYNEDCAGFKSDFKESQSPKIFRMEFLLIFSKEVQKMKYITV